MHCVEHEKLDKEIESTKDLLGKLKDKVKDNEVPPSAQDPEC